MVKAIIDLLLIGRKCESQLYLTTNQLLEDTAGKCVRLQLNIMVDPTDKNLSTPQCKAF